MLIPTATETATLRVTAYFSITWDDGVRDRGTFLVIFDSVNTDIVFQARIQVIESAGALVGMDHFFQRAPLLPVCGGCGYSVASDIWSEWGEEVTIQNFYEPGYIKRHTSDGPIEEEVRESDRPMTCTNRQKGGISFNLLQLCRVKTSPQQFRVHLKIPRQV